MVRILKFFRGEKFIITNHIFKNLIGLMITKCCTNHDL